MLDDFAVFILTHGRPDKVITYDTLKRQGYTGDIYIIIDNEDKKADEYKAKYGDKVIVFDKAAIAQTFDEGDNFGDRRAVIYARNACFGIARDLGVKYFLQLDDDYTEIRYKFTADLVYIPAKLPKKLDKLFDCILRYYKSINALSVAMLQGGDMLGGAEGGYAKSIKLFRKCMNTFFCSTDRPFTFFGRINEDVNTYTCHQNRGNLFLSFNNLTVEQKATQSNSGGMTELYLDSGTYVKSFYTVMYMPSCVRVAEMRSRHRRLHHRIKWDNAVPCIVDEKHRKASRLTN